MKLRGPRTLLGLILSSLALVTLPLLIAIGNAAFRLGQLTQDSESTLNSAATSTLENRRLDTLLINMERNARQYLLLGADRSLELYREDQDAMRDSVVELSSLSNAAEVSTELRFLATEVEKIEDLLAERGSPQAEEQLIDSFRRMDAAAEMVAEKMRSAINEQMSALQDDTSSAQQMLAWQAAALVPLTVILTAFFLALIVRPMRKIDRAIRELGSGNYSEPIAITGPADIETLAKQLEWLRDKLEESTNEKNKFLRHMSHELKTPLANIREGSELLMDGSVGTLAHEQEEVADILRLNSIKLQRLIENLLTYSAWQSKSATLEISRFELKPLVFSVISQHRLAISKSRIKLRLRVSTVSLLADANKIRLILDNLISNAVKFTPEHGTISVIAAVTDDTLAIDVGDTGPGIAPDERDRVFDAFFQGKRLQGGPVGGTGIGLSIVNECVQAYGGAVELGETESGGALFRIRLPVRQVNEALPLAANE
jgi:two-component system, NtrC family, sensor histidine kinase GlrK